MNENNLQSEGGAAASATTAATAGAEQIVDRGRGRPKGSFKKSPGNAKPDPSANFDDGRRAELQAQFDRLYDPVVWEGIVAAPANIALAFTGSKIWDLPADEKKTLAIQASVTARCFAVADPKYLALTMLSISILTIYGGRALQYYTEKIDAKKARENKIE